MSEQHERTQVNDELFLQAYLAGKFIVNDDGTVYNKTTNRIVGHYNDKGYLVCSMKHEGKTRKIKIHRLVWMVNNGRIPFMYEVNHRDGNKSNNRIGNLEAITGSENMKHAYIHGLLSKCVGAIGSRNNYATLNETLVREIRRRQHNNETCKCIAETMNLKYQTVWNVIKGRAWKHID